MKKLVLFLCLLGTAFLCPAQTEQFKKGQLDAQLGFGFIQGAQFNLYAGPTISPVDFKSPPVRASVDYAVTDQISVGGFIGYAKAYYAHYDDNYENFSVTTIGARGLYHFDVHERLDTYAGIGIGTQSHTGTAHGYFFDDPDYTYTKSSLRYTLVGGTRYRLSEKFAAFLELNYNDVSTVHLGINIKLKQ